MVNTTYKQLHGELEGHFKAEYRDDEIAVLLYADNVEELYRAVRFLKIRNLDCDTLTELIANKHEKDEEVA